MKNLLLSVSVLLCFSLSACGQNNKNDENIKKNSSDDNVKAKITFVELGSVNCVPCKMMQPVMKAVEEKYGNQLEVIFYDVWKPEQKKYAQEYGIKLIPTQVFLDEDGTEFFRHEGFFAEENIDSLLQSKGLQVLQENES